METLDLIKRLHAQFLNRENPTQQPECSPANDSKSKKNEIIHVSGRLEIL